MLRELGSEREPGEVKPAEASNIAAYQRLASSVRPLVTWLATRASRVGGVLNRKVSLLRFEAKLSPAANSHLESNLKKLGKKSQDQAY